MVLSFSELGKIVSRVDLRGEIENSVPDMWSNVGHLGLESGARLS